MPLFPHGSCFFLVMRLMFRIVVNIFTDVTIIALPITMVSRLQMKLKDKIGVAGIFALGFLVVIASCKILNFAGVPICANSCQKAFEPTTQNATKPC